MGHSATAWDQNSVLEVVKDWNGIDQVVLRVPRGASARVRYYPIDSFFSVKTCIHSEVRIEGLETLDYLDNLCQRKRFTEQGDAVTFESEVTPLSYELYNANFTNLQVDRIYLGSPNVIAVLDHEKKRTFLIKKKGLPDVGMMLS
ncbi:hypothetical protein B296_00028745 [Ensete ventricosum]|uniref:Uncharacterized protein n=1 Tax=Ensete ventricosum TaxID=4639 RepID=A0A426Z333_ENSVE|nr:hypothetical protein B296_00028745 [Ensete ventricosum]